MVIRKFWFLIFYLIEKYIIFGYLEKVKYRFDKLIYFVSIILDFLLFY